ncbi:hypothetical protein GGI12_002669, partial [Dipsacomyces acuminosporus]
PAYLSTVDPDAAYATRPPYPTRTPEHPPQPQPEKCDLAKLVKLLEPVLQAANLPLTVNGVQQLVSQIVGKLGLPGNILPAGLGDLLTHTLTSALSSLLGGQTSCIAQVIQQVLEEQENQRATKCIPFDKIDSAFPLLEKLGLPKNGFGVKLWIDSFLNHYKLKTTDDAFKSQNTQKLEQLITDFVTPVDPNVLKTLDPRFNVTLLGHLRWTLQHTLPCLYPPAPLSSLGDTLPILNNPLAGIIPGGSPLSGKSLLDLSGLLSGVTGLLSGAKVAGLPAGLT